MQELAVEPQLTWMQERALEEAYDGTRKKLWLAYLLAVPLGCVGAHRFYLGRKRSGFAMMALWLTGILITWIIVLTMPGIVKAMMWETAAGVLMLAAWVWELVDLFLIPGILCRVNAALEAEMKFKLLTGQTL